MLLPAAPSILKSPLEVSMLIYEGTFSGIRPSLSAVSAMILTIPEPSSLASSMSWCWVGKPRKP